MKNFNILTAAYCLGQLATIMQENPWGGTLAAICCICLTMIACKEGGN
jgi:hypothetical protein